MNKLSTLGNATGVIIIISSVIRWFFMFYDLSQMAIGLSIGVIILGFAHVYNWMIQIEKK